jgi:hypothetical protein
MSVFSAPSGNLYKFTGASTDSKPTTAIQPGSIFTETDTLNQFIFGSDYSWHPYYEHTAIQIWQPSTLSYIYATADASGNLNVTGGGGGGGGSVTQGTTPWVDNISQFGGSAVVTGTGASGAGIPRVTVSNDSTVNTKTSLTANSPTAASVGVTSAQILAANSSRKGLILTNTSNNNISLGFGSAAVLNSGITLYPNGVFSMDEYMFTTSAINAIASVASSNLGIQEWQ